MLIIIVFTKEICFFKPLLKVFTNGEYHFRVL